MNQTNRKSKFHAKIQTKFNQKSSLPQIDPIHQNSTKNTNNFVPNHTLKPVKQKPQDPLSSTRTQLRPKQTNSILNLNTIISNQQHEHTSQYNLTHKHLSISSQKQQATADTIRQQFHTATILQHSKQPDAKGFDMWNLNKNLKQFSQTRKLPFYKHKNHSTKDNSFNNHAPQSITITQHMNKTKTQQLRSMYKIYGGNQSTRIPHSQRQRSEGHLDYKKIAEPIKKVKIAQKDAKSFSTITNNTKLISPLGNTLYGTLPVRKHQSTLDTTYYNKETHLKDKINYKNQHTDHNSSHINPYLRTFINGSHLKRQNSNRNIHILEMNSFGARDNKYSQGGVGKNEQRKDRNFRRNRFEKIGVQFEKQSIRGENQDLPKGQYSKSLNCSINPNRSDQQQNSQHSQPDQPQPTQNLTTSLPNNIQFPQSNQAQQKKKNYQYLRSIQRINKSILKNSNDYVQNYYTFNKLPNSKIEFYIDSLNHPEFNGNTVQYKSSYKGDVFQEHDASFGFKDIKQVATDKDKGKKQVSLGKTKKQSSKNKINRLS